MANNMDPVQSLIEIANDATNNMYVCKYKADTSSGGAVDITARLEKFAIPAWTVPTHKIGLHGVQIDVPNTKIEMERKVEMTFRIQANYQNYKSWMKVGAYAGNARGGVANVVPSNSDLIITAIQNAYVGFGANSSYPGENMPSEVLGADAATENDIQWKFHNFWVANVSQPEFVTDGDGTPLTFTVTGYFGKCEYPGMEEKANA